MHIAHINELTQGLNELIIEGHKIFIYKYKNNINVYGSVCPHQGATLHCNKEANEIYCKVHDWRFNAKNGESYNIKNANLFTHNARIDTNGNIFLDDCNLKTNGGGGVMAAVFLELVMRMPLIVNCQISQYRYTPMRA